MTRLLVAGLLVAHGLVHAAVYAASKPDAPNAPFDPGHSWAPAAADVTGTAARMASVRLAWAAAALGVVAGVGLIVDAALWAPVAAGAAMVGLLLKVLWFHPWLTVGVLIDVGVVWATVTEWPPSLF